MKLSERIAVWFIKRRLKKEFRMKPLPKWVGWISAVAALFGAGGALSDAIPPRYGAVVAGVAAIVSNLTHSLNGTGGKAATD